MLIKKVLCLLDQNHQMQSLSYQVFIKYILYKKMFYYYAMEIK